MTIFMLEERLVCLRTHQLVRLKAGEIYALPRRDAVRLIAAGYAILESL